jgi:hypothetical protein
MRKSLRLLQHGQELERELQLHQANCLRVLADLRALLRRWQPKLRAAALLPRRATCGMVPTTMPEEAISAAEYTALMAHIKT